MNVFDELSSGARIVFILVFGAAAVICFNKAIEANDRHDARQEELWQAQDELRALISRKASFDRELESLKRLKTAHIARGQQLYAEREKQLQELAHTRYPESVALGIEAKNSQMVKLLAELEEIEEQTEQFKQVRRKKADSLDVEIQATRDIINRNGPYKDAELNKWEGRSQFWAMGVVVSVLILSAVFPPLRWLLLTILAVATLGAFTKDR